MIREEEIRKAAFDYADTELIGIVDFKKEAAFIKGAMWADEHPRWISVEDELPKDGECVATINTVGVKDVRHYSHGKWYSNFGNEYDDITHWMRLPAEPKKGGAQ